MKFIKSLLISAALVLLAALPASAQYDYFASAKTYPLVWPQTVNAGSSSNFCTDIHGSEGICKVDIITITNGACSAATLSVYTSPDRTNWTALANYAVATSNSIITTNVDVVFGGNVYPGPMLATNIIMRAGTLTYPNANLAGFATPYVVPAPFTNNAALTLSNGLQTIGFVAPDQARYIQFFYSFTGASTNTVAAVLTVRKQIE